MTEKENEQSPTGLSREGDSVGTIKSNRKSETRKNKRKSMNMTEKEHEQSPTGLTREGDAVDTIESNGKSESRKNKRKSTNMTEKEHEQSPTGLSREGNVIDTIESNRKSETRKNKRKSTNITEKEHEQSPTGLSREGDAVDTIESNRKSETRKNKRKKLLLKETAKADKLGVCYLSRIPPRMDPSNLRHILSQYGEILRIYLKPEGPEAQVHRKRAGGFRGQGFTEGWVEFAKKNVAKRVAGMLNGEQIGGRKRSPFYYDIWNIKYLSKFKWDNLTDEIAYKNAIREQKLALEISAARRERDFYLSKVDKSRALTSIQDRVMKKQKVQQGSDPNSDTTADQQEPKVIRQFPQTRPFADNSDQSKPKISKDFLAGVFGASS